MDKMSKTGNEVDPYVEVNLSEIHPKTINSIVNKSEKCARRCRHDDFDSCMSHDRICDVDG